MLRFVMRCDHCNQVYTHIVDEKAAGSSKVAYALSCCQKCGEPHCKIVEIRTTDFKGQLSFGEEYLDEYLHHGSSYIRERLAFEDEIRFRLQSLLSDLREDPPLSRFPKHWNIQIGDKKQSIFSLFWREIGQAILAVIIFSLLIFMFLLIVEKSKEPTKDKVEQFDDPYAGWEEDNDTDW